MKVRPLCSHDKALLRGRDTLGSRIARVVGEDIEEPNRFGFDILFRILQIYRSTFVIGGDLV